MLLILMKGNWHGEVGERQTFRGTLAKKDLFHPVRASLQAVYKFYLSECINMQNPFFTTTHTCKITSVIQYVLAMGLMFLLCPSSNKQSSPFM